MYGYGGYGDNAMRPKRPMSVEEEEALRLLQQAQTPQVKTPPSLPARAPSLPVSPDNIPPINDFGGGNARLDRPSYITPGNEAGSLQRAPLPSYSDDTMSEVGVPIPSLSGPNRTRPYDPVEYAKYEYQTRDRRPTRPYTQVNQETGQEEFVNKAAMYAPQRTKRSFMDILKTAGVGALQGMATGGLGGAIGGALAGGLTSAISPETGRGYRFETLQRPRMEADMMRQLMLRKQAMEQAQAQAELEQRRATTQKIQAEIPYIGPDKELEREGRKSQIEYNRQRAEALKKGPPPRYTPEEEARRQERHIADMKRIEATIRKMERTGKGGGGGSAAQSDKSAMVDLGRLYDIKRNYIEAVDKGSSEAAVNGYKDMHNRLAQAILRKYPDVYELKPSEEGLLEVRFRGVPEPVFPKKPEQQQEQPSAPTEQPGLLRRWVDMMNSNLKSRPSVLPKLPQ